MDVRKLLKVYNYVNNEKRPKVNLKFAGALLAFLVAGALLVGFLVTQHGAGGKDAASNASNACAPKTAYVGMDPNHLSGTAPSSSLTADQAYASWAAEHKGDTVTKKEPLTMAGVTVGYQVTYVPAKC